MALENINAASNPATSVLSNKATSSNSGADALAKTQSDFLKLLTTQLKNQDPTNPQDTGEFTSQLIGFSSVEQQLNTNTKLDALVESQTSTALNAQLSSSVNYIGKMVEVQGDTFDLSATSEPKFSYDVPSGTSNSVISIFNASGVPIGSFKGSSSAGKQNLVWDGKGSDGERLPVGTYKFRVDVVDAENKTAAAKTYVLGEVTSIHVEDNKTKLVVDDRLLVPIEDVYSVGQKQTTAEAA